MRTKQEGDLFDIITVDEISFEIRYGYHEGFERESWEPMPIFPDLESNPVYNSRGEPFVTHMQSVCRHYKPRSEFVDNESCADCAYFHAENKQLIGICKSEVKKTNIKKTNIREVSINDKV